MAIRTVTVREFARLTTASVPVTMDLAQVTDADFDWLCTASAKLHAQSGTQVLHFEDRRTVRLNNYVGVLESPSGLRLEILPKHVEASDRQSVQQARILLRRMLESALDITPRKGGDALLEAFAYPLTEWVMRRFLQALEHAVKRGLRSDYLRVEETQRYLRGQLDMAKQMRLPAGRTHFFELRHDVFSLDRPENRLLKSALVRVFENTRDSENWRCANELLHMFRQIPASAHIEKDFRSWCTDRLMSHYAEVHPWCEIVLGNQTPLALHGQKQGISLLFPMERLFERFVGHSLRKLLPNEYRLTEQASRHWLCEHAGNGIFRLRPDYLIEGCGKFLILDAKWKLLDGRDRENHYGLKQADFYQLFAYGQKYSGGCGDLILVYPRTRKFDRPLPPFDFAAHLRLRVLPFDLDQATVHGLGELLASRNAA
jgi:5-methylcytosine-specific restriction enzyme subunit McrC